MGNVSSISPNECHAINYLHADGYSFVELQRMFQVTSVTIENHLSDCDCPELAEPTEIPDISPEDILELRYEQDMSQTDFAYKLDVSPGTVSTWESGRSKPKATNRQKLLELMGVLDDEQ